MNKKILKILSLALAAAIAVSVSACSSHEHDVSKWVTVTEPTCMKTGVEEGICAVCGETIYRDIAVDEDNHSYGDWEITRYPTESRVGRAEKTCTNESDDGEKCGNSLLITLPVLGDSRYTTSIVTRPTATEDGVRSYSLYNEYGNIEFEVTISSSGITSVMDAVEVACDDISHDAIRSGSGTVANAYYSAGKDPDTSTSYPFSYEFGDGYTHIDDTSADSKERWYSIDSDGNIFGYCCDSSSGFANYYDETKRTSGSESYIYGYRYIFEYSTFVGTYYGAENFIAGLYSSAKQNVNGDFEESVNEYSNKDTEYYFKYGTRDSTGTYFAIVEVTFTLSSENTIKTCTALCTAYVNSTSDGITTWELNEDGYAEVTAATGMRYVSSFTFTQVTKTEDPEEPENPYSAEAMHISDYDIVYNNSTEVDENGNLVSEGVVVGDDDVIYITARQATQSTYTYTDIQYDADGLNPELVTVEATVNHFYITNVSPSNMEDNVSEDISFYYRKYSGTSYADLEINANTATDSSSSVGVACNFNSSTNSFFILSKISGYVDIVIKTYNTERVLHFYVEPIAPTTLYPDIYEYNTSGYTWYSGQSAAESGEAVTGSVYAGQNFYFTSGVPETEENFADPEYTVSVTGAVDVNGNEISSEYYTLVNEYETESLFKGQSMSVFNATKAGTYTLTMVSVRDSSVTCTIIVTVEDIPERSELFSGTYTSVIKLGYDPYGSVSLTFEAGESEGVYYAVVTSTENVETLICHYDGETLTSEHYSGADNGFTLTFNEAYDLVISHSTGILDDDGSYIMESVNLTRSE